MRPDEEIARCDAEIAAMSAQTDIPAWLVTLGVSDWELERELLEKRRTDETSTNGRAVE